jgi:hypothetical protein
MAQNTSHAVMAQRHEVHDSLDDFPTQPWATRALCEHVLPKADLQARSVWEPACNRGHMVRPLQEYFRRVYASDIHDYGFQFDGQERVVDFLFPFSTSPSMDANGVDWVITNPPFRLAEQFIARASQVAKVGFAVIVRTSFLEGVGRYTNLFSKNPPSIIAQFSERVPMVKGRLTATGSTATAYCWLVWIDGEPNTRFVWIPPCRRQLEREGDYPVAEVAA